MKPSSGFQNLELDLLFDDPVVVLASSGKLELALERSRDVARELIELLGDSGRI